MKKVYTTLFAACAVLGASAAMPQVAFNPEIQCNKVPTAESIELISKMQQSAPVKLQGVESRAEAYCTEASFHYDDVSFPCFDQLGMSVEKTEKDGQTVFTVNDFYHTSDQKLEIYVDENNIATVPLQHVLHIDNFWTGDDPDLDVSVCSYSELPKVASYIFGDKVEIALEQAKNTAVYDPITGTIRVPMVYLFYTDLSFGTETRKEWYPFAWIFVQTAQNPNGFLSNDYDILRKETLQLGNYGEPYVGKYTDSFLVSLGFEPGTWDVAYQYNTLFPATMRISNPYANDPELGEDEFKKFAGGELVEGLIYVYNVEGKRFLGNTYAGLNLSGTEFSNFAFNSYINFYLLNANPWESVKEITEVVNDNQVLSEYPFGIYTNNNTLEFDAYANLYTPVVEIDAMYGEMASDDMNFVSNNYFKLVTSEADGVQAVAADNTNAAVEYFNLQGVRVENPRQGMFIRCQGTEVSKVVL